jgi:hypothetical protein
MRTLPPLARIHGNSMRFADQKVRSPKVRLSEGNLQEYSIRLEYTRHTAAHFMSCYNDLHMITAR